MAIPDQPAQLWDAPLDPTGQDEAVQRLSQMVSGNRNLIAHPGLVQAMYTGNMTAPQAGAINEFIGGLEAEKLVRTAGAAGTKINLTGTQQQALTHMGVDFSPVLQTAPDAVAELTAEMAKQGVKPRLDANGTPLVDANGHNLTDPIVKKKKQDNGWFSSVGNFFHHLTHNPVTNAAFKNAADGPDGESGLQTVSDLATGGYNIVSANISSIGDGPDAAANADNAALMTRLGYDPNSIMSTLAFQAKGYQHSSTTDTASKWDDAHPDGSLGWDGRQAVTEAEAFAADPEKYRTTIENDPTLTGDQVAEKLRNISSGDFQNLVRRVNGDRADIGANTARDIGIDPVDHPTLFKTVAAGTNFAASFFVDPLTVGLNGLQAARLTNAAIKDMTNAEDVRRFFTGPSASMTQSTVRAHLNDAVTYANQLREAHAAGDIVGAARAQAAVDRNPFAPLVEDFLGRNRILRMKSDAELAVLKKGESPFVTGSARPITTYQGAVNYLASKSALLKVTGGHAAVEGGVMPGALSNYGYVRLRGSMSGWSAGRSAAKSVARKDEFVGWAQADPMREQHLIDDGTLHRFDAAPDDAIEASSGKVLAAQKAFDTSKGLADTWQTAATATHSAWRGAIAQGKAAGKWRPDVNDLASDAARTKNVAASAAAQAEIDKAALASAQRAHNARLQAAAVSEAPTLTDKGEGVIRRNMLDYGKAVAPESLTGRILAYGTLGVVQRAKLAVSRFTNWLPRDTRIDLTTAAAANSLHSISRTYMTQGDAALLKVRWVTGNAETRKTIVEGLKDQIGHAAGLSRTKAGRELMTKWKTESQRYSTTGEEVLDDNNQASALYAGQVQQKFNLPNFGAVHKAASKVGLYEGTIGRLLGTTPVERLMVQWKLGALFTPVTAVRANIETWLNSAVDGMFVKGLRAKAVLRESGALDGPLLDRSRVADKLIGLGGKKSATGDILRYGPLQQVGRVYRHVLLAGMSDADREAAFNLSQDLFDSYIHNQAAMHYAMSLDPGGVTEITDAAQAGFPAGRLKINTANGWNSKIRSRTSYEFQDQLDGVNGANAYAHALGMRVNDAPGIARALVAHIEQAVPGDLTDVVHAMNSEHLMGHTLYGKVFWREDGTQARVVTDAERALGKTQFAQRVVNDMRVMVTGRNGVVNKELTGYIARTGQAPDADWLLENVKGLKRPGVMNKPTIVTMPNGEKASLVNEADQRPTGVLAPKFEDLTEDSKKQNFVNQLLDVEGRGYQWLVERQIQRHSTSPMFLAAYTDARVGLEGFKQKLIEHGLSDEAAERAAQVAAADQGWNRIARMVDDPAMKSQMDVVGRSFFAFSRATTMMLRRWGSTLWRNPVAARRMMLAAEGAVDSGVVYKDEYGDWQFHFPGSGVAQEVILHAMSHVPFLKDMASFPVSDFRGRVTSIIPGSDNPFQYNTTPMISISSRWLANHGWLKEHREMFDAIDKKLNGSAGAGQGIVATLTPNLVKKYLDAKNDDERNSMAASAMVGSLFNLYAAGLTPKDGASPSEMDDFRSRLSTQAHSQLYLRAIFGAFSPASVGLPDNETDASAPDYAFAASGAQGLRDEFKRLLNDVHGDFARANVIWTGLHPDKTVFEQSGSQAMTSKADMPATQAAYDWMEAHSDFISKYKSVAAYFIPAPDSNEPFSLDAYRAQLETGLRQRKTPKEFLDGVRSAGAATSYYAMEDKYKADVAQAKLTGNTAAASQHRKDWLAWSHAYKADHSTFAQQTYQGADNHIAAVGQVNDLRDMVKNGDVPGGISDAVSGMVQAYDGYEAFIGQHAGQDAAATAMRAQALGQFQDYLTQMVAAHPEVSDLYAGVFRRLNSNLNEE